jgi:hypothetical protein
MQIHNKVFKAANKWAKVSTEDLCFVDANPSTTSQHDMMCFVGKEEGELGFTHFLHLSAESSKLCYLNSSRTKLSQPICP